ncbi:MAG: hypothetical protein H7842_13200, partial [Gammaproteobacteria bacterium SHHR-1]
IDAGARIVPVREEQLKERLGVRIPRHLATQSINIRPVIPSASGHLNPRHRVERSERSDAGGALLLDRGWYRQV